MRSGQSGHDLSLDEAVSDSDMDLLEATTHPFVIRIWLEETVEEAGRAMWRGHITHVPSGERRYFKDLDDIALFIGPYLEEMGVEFRPCRRVRQWLKRL